MTERVLYLTADANAPRRVAAFAHACAQDAGFDTREAHRVELALDEACSNVVDHAYRGAAGSIQLTAQIEPSQKITFELVDQGQSFNPDAIFSPTQEAALDERAVGGLGLFIIRETMDEVRFEFDVPNVGNRLTMTKLVSKIKHEK